MKQSDEILRTYTVAKITMDCDFTAPLQEMTRPKKDAWGNNVLDDQQEIIWETVMQTDENGVDMPVMEEAYSMRYLLLDGTRITKEEYDTAKAAGIPVYRAAFVGCVYHCG